MATRADTGVWRVDPDLFDRALARCAGDGGAVDRELSGPEELEPAGVPPSRERVARGSGIKERRAHASFRACWEVDAFRWPGVATEALRLLGTVAA